VVECCRSRPAALAQLGPGPSDKASGGCDDSAHMDTPPTQEPPSSLNRSLSAEEPHMVMTTTDDTVRVSQNSHLDFAVLANYSCGESISAAHVLSHLVRGKTQMQTAELLHPRDVQDCRGECPTLGCLCVLLTQGCLASEGFPRTLVAALEAWGTMTVLTVTMTGFEFPSSEVMSGSVVPQAAKLLSESEDRISTTYKQLFSILACPFSPHGHISVLHVEVEGILRRMRSDSKRCAEKNSRRHSDESSVSRQSTTKSSGGSEAPASPPSAEV